MHAPGRRRPWPRRPSADDSLRGSARGYARMMRKVVTRRGVPRSIYSDRDSVFRAVEDGSPTQFAFMMRDLDVRMIFAGL